MSLDLGFPHGIKALKTLTSVFRSFPFCLPHLFHKYIHKASHPKSCSFRKLITKISPLHQNRQNPYYPIRIQVCTRSHARPIASKILRSLHALPHHQVLVLPLLATDSSGHHFHSIDWRPIYPNPSETASMEKSCAATCGYKKLTTDPRSSHAAISRECHASPNQIFDPRLSWPRSVTRYCLQINLKKKKKKKARKLATTSEEKKNHFILGFVCILFFIYFVCNIEKKKKKKKGETFMGYIYFD